MSDEVLLRRRTLTGLRWFVAFAQMGAGFGILYNGADAFDLPQFRAHAAWLPWWVWGTTAFVSGLAIYVKPIRIIGLGMSAVWWSCWSSLLIVGIVIQRGPFASVFTYLLIIFVHVLLAVVEFVRWWNRRKT